jgi:DNA-directed RNA polymerase specialized sigma24 family protein
MGIIDPSRDSLLSGADEGAPARGPAAAAAQADREEEQALVRAVLGGSVAAWHLFIERYSGVLQAVIRRNLYSNDEDDVRTIYVDILSSLYRGRLATFAGRSTLSSWLVLVARSHTMDFLRHRFGRRELPDGVEKLAPRDREVFRLFHLEGFGVGEILERMSRNGDRFEVDDLLAAIQRIEERIGRRTLQRCDYHRQARSRGTGSGRLLESVR